MKARVLTSVVGIALLGIVLVFYDSILFNIVMSGVTLLAIHEVYNAFKFGKSSLFLFLGFIPITFLVMFSDYIRVQSWLQPACYIFVLYLAVCLIINVDHISFAKLSGMTVFSAVILFCFYSLINLKSQLPQQEYGLDAVYFMVLILGFAWGGDTFAFFAGSAFGKHKLAPRVSPKKTVEGAIGGLLGSMLLGVVITFIYVQVFGWAMPGGKVHVIYYLYIALLGAVASILGVLGDLFASAVKRQNGIKDYGTIFPGHGGIMDRFDSVLFIAPLVSMAVKAVYYRLL